MFQGRGGVAGRVAGAGALTLLRALESRPEAGAALRSRASGSARSTREEDVRRPHRRPAPVEHADLAVGPPRWCPPPSECFPRMKPEKKITATTKVTPRDDAHPGGDLGDTAVPRSLLGSHHRRGVVGGAAVAATGAVVLVELSAASLMDS